MQNYLVYVDNPRAILPVRQEEQNLICNSIVLFMRKFIQEKKKQSYFYFIALIQEKIDYND